MSPVAYPAPLVPGYQMVGTPPDSVVFDMLLNVTLAYQAWF